jgi:ABC-type antimicrobial peptide transport system permease subunit
MTLRSFLLILTRQLSNKWGRFLLASGGIMVGIWAITLTSGLSLGLSQTIVQAINSQPGAREISVYRSADNKTSFFEITEAPKFKAISLAKLDEIKTKYPEVVGVTPQEILNLYQLPNQPNFSCTQEAVRIQNAQAALNNPLLSQSNPATPTTPPANPEEQKAKAEGLQTELNSLQDKCPTLSIISTVFDNFYESNKSNWSGKTSSPARGEIVTCYKCGSRDFGKKLGADNPEQLLGKEITLEFQRTPNLFKSEEIVDVLNSTSGGEQIKTSEKVTFKIVSVVDDREANAFGGNAPYFLDFSYFTDAIKLVRPDWNKDQLGFVQASVFLKNYQDQGKIIDQLRGNGYLAFSITQAIVSAVQTAFVVLTAVLAAFGLIALIASVFGIVNVMTISVLERQKEIGILKSLGAFDRDIFWIFLLESMLLGFIGWLFGTLVSILMGQVISFAFTRLVAGNQTWRDNLEALNITNFGPDFPWWLLLSTLGLALFFTILSGVFPAIRASRQNPVEVLRAE